MAGHNLVTLALGMKARLRTNVETGFAWEFPLSNQKDLMDNRLICEFIVRY
jgi:predicted secreted protein